MKQLKMKRNDKKGGFLRVLLGILAASTLRNALTGKGGIRADEGVIRASQDF